MGGVTGQTHASFEHHIEAIATDDLDTVKRILEHVAETVAHAVESGAQVIHLHIQGEVHSPAKATTGVSPQEPATATDATVTPETPAE